MNLLRGDPDVESSIKKATSLEEVAPKRKHVRACVVYTWDHKSAREFWNAVRLLPLTEEIQIFKMLITIHKVIQEGHGSVLRDAQHQVNWLQSIQANHSHRSNYGRLIDEYVRLLLHKLEFHRLHNGFNGTFEYEEYISLRTTDDPNEGYEAIIDLMNLQDAIEDFQRLVFASLRGRHGNECRISSLTAMVTESYGIYRFIISMMRAMHQIAGDLEAMEPLRQRFVSQHKRLRNFYFDCETLKYLTSLITIPQLSEESPNLDDENKGPSLPPRPREKMSAQMTGATTATSDTTPLPMNPEPTGGWWAQNNALEQEQQHFADQQRQLEAQAAQQEMLRQQAQADFEAEQQRLAAEQQAAQQLYAQQLAQQQYQGHATELEHDLFQARQQQQEAQNMLQQYDNRMQSLENDLAQAQNLSQQQIDAQSAQIASLQEQVDSWRAKYESLAKLYSQLRQEHLDLIAKTRKLQAKAASAQESVDKRERLERDLKSKNLELADLIRERDRARYELDRARGSHAAELEKVERELNLARDKDRTRNDAIAELSASHSRQLENLRIQADPGALQEKDDEIDVLKETVREMENALKDLSLSSKASKSSNVLDAILLSAADRIQQALTSFDSPLDGGNTHATAHALLGLTEKSTSNTSDFADTFTDFIAAGDEGDPVPIINAVTTLSNSFADMLTESKGLALLQADSNVTESLLGPTRDAAVSLCAFYSSLHSDLLADLTTDDVIELIVTSHLDIQQRLHELSEAAEAVLPKGVLASGSYDSQVSDAMSNLASTVADANSRLTALLADPRIARYDKAVNEAIVEATVVLTTAIAELIRASAACQREIVSKGRGGQSAEMYYKKNHRWTQGLVSAVRMVAGATNFLIETADSTLSGTSTPEELIVSAREVAASTTQLTMASRVKVDYLSKNQDDMDAASKHVLAAVRDLSHRVETILAKASKPSEPEVDVSSLSPMEFKKASMEQQVEVLKLENDLQHARVRLAEMRQYEI